MRGGYRNLHLCFYIVCLDADASVITGVGCGDSIRVALGCSRLPVSLCSKCLAPVAAGGGSCCQDTLGLLQEWFPTFAEPSSGLCLLVWEGKTAELQKENLGGGEGAGSSAPGMVPSRVLATDNGQGHHQGPKSAWVYCELWRTLLSTFKPPKKDISWLQDPLRRGPIVKQSVVGGLGVNRQKEDESGVESWMQPATS